MAKHLNDKVGSMEYDKLIAGGAPSCAAAPAPAATAS